MNLFDKFPLSAYLVGVDVVEREQISSNMSEVAKFILDSWETAMHNNKAILLAYPYSNIPFLPVLAYLTASASDKDVLIVTKNVHGRLIDYELLSKMDGQFIHNFCIPLTIENSTAVIKIVSPQVPVRRRKLEAEYLLSIASLPSFRKIVFCDYAYLTEALQSEQNTLFADLGKELNIALNIGAVFFEEFNRSLHDRDAQSIFVKWIKDNSERFHVLIHTSQCYNNKNSMAAEHASAYYIDINHYLLREMKQKLNTISTRYDLVPQRVTEPDVSISAPIPLPNIDDVSLELRSLARDIARQGLPDVFKSMMSLPTLLRNLMVHPSHFKFTMINNEGNFTCGTVDDYLHILIEELSSVDQEKRLMIRTYLSKLSTLYNELKETERYGEPDNYKTKCKNSVLMNYLATHKTSDVGKITVVCYTRTEARILRDQISRLGLTDLSWQVKSFKELLTNDAQEDLIILPGLPYNKDDFLTVINQNRKVLVLTYDGWECERASNMINKASENAHTRLNESVSSITRTAEATKLPIPLLLRQTVQPVPLADQTSETDSGEAKEVDDPISFEIALNEYSAARSAGTGSGEDASDLVLVTHLATSTQQRIYCGNRSKFCQVTDSGEYSTIFLDELSEGDIILRFGKSNEDILDLLADLYGVDEKIDTDSIKLWKTLFADNVAKKRTSTSTGSLKLKAVYDDYVTLCRENKTREKTYQSFRLWVLDKQIGPEDPNDVLILGVMGDFPNIRRDYKYVYDQIVLIRSMHVQIGKQIAKIIRRIMHRQSEGNLNYQEKFLAEKVQLFRVDKILKLKT